MNNRLVDHLAKCGLFAAFQYSYRSSWSTADFLTVVPDITANVFNRDGFNWAIALGSISKTFDRVWHARLLHKLGSYGISGWVFGLIFSFLSNRQPRLVLDCKSIQSMLEFLKAPFLVLHLSYYTLITFLMILFVILLSMLMILHPTMWSCLWFVVTTRMAFWTWNWPTRHCRLGQEVACWFQCSKNSTCFLWLV